MLTTTRPPTSLRTPLVKFTPPARVIIIIVTKYCNSQVLIAIPLISNLNDSLHRQFHFQIDIPTQVISYKHTDKK